jgi:hypothetical protein
MQNVTVKCSDLLFKVQANRDAHRDLFLKAQEGYRTAVIAELDKMLAEARDNKPIRRMVSLPEPIDHTKDYERVLAMLAMSTDSEIELQAHEFDQYVLDNWDWKQHALFTNSSYLAR